MKNKKKIKKKKRKRKDENNKGKRSKKKKNDWLRTLRNAFGCASLCVCESLHPCPLPFPFPESYPFLSFHMARGVKGRSLDPGKINFSTSGEFN